MKSHEIEVCSAFGKIVNNACGQWSYNSAIDGTTLYLAHAAQIAKDKFFRDSTGWIDPSNWTMHYQPAKINGP